jgi:ketosteroid isomerase-like protein
MTCEVLMGERSAAERTVRVWQEAVNGGDIERLLDLSDESVEIVGPRGVARGHDVLRDWAMRAGAQFHPRRVFARDDAVVVEQRGVWRSESGEVVGEQDVATVFSVADGRVTRVARLDDLAEALRQAGLSESDERRGA